MRENERNNPAAETIFAHGVAITTRRRAPLPDLHPWRRLGEILAEKFERGERGTDVWLADEDLGQNRAV